MRKENEKYKKYGQAVLPDIGQTGKSGLRILMGRKLFIENILPFKNVNIINEEGVI